MRPKIVAGNWKMNGDLSFMRAYLAIFLGSDCMSQSTQNGVQIVLAPPATLLHGMRDLVGSEKALSLQLAGQNVAATENGAFTGEVSASMLLDAGCAWCIVGHSERRALFGETDRDVVAKTGRLLQQGLRPIVCVGETLEQRDAGEAELVVARQINAVLNAFEVEQLRELVFAYEPIWAIGTGRTASPEQAQQMHRAIRGLVSVRSEELAQGMAILYGGSVNASNAEELFAQPDVDGGLVGGASLKALEFAQICGLAG